MATKGEESMWYSRQAPNPISRSSQIPKQSFNTSNHENNVTILLTNMKVQDVKKSLRSWRRIISHRAGVGKLLVRPSF